MQRAAELLVFQSLPTAFGVFLAAVSAWPTQQQIQLADLDVGGYKSKQCTVDAGSRGSRLTYVRQAYIVTSCDNSLERSDSYG